MKKSVAALGAVAAMLALAGLAAWVLMSGWAAGVAALLLLAAAAVAALVAQGGRIALERQRRVDAARPDLFLERNRSRSEAAVLAGEARPVGAARRWIARHLLDHRFLAADSVRIKPYEQIRATLDAEGRLEGLSFMEEMKAFCGRPARVYRVLDKIYDYGRSRGMRQLDRCVLLVGLRCDGGAHGGCDAACYTVWKEAWLEAASHDEPLTLSPVLQQQEARAPLETGKLFNCQYTELTHASRPGAARGLRGLLEPWIVGNVTAGGCWVVALTRAFNAFQALRGGATYPTRPASGGQTSKPGEPVKRGDWVRVRSPAEIALTLDAKGHHRGLWFVRDMLKHCGQPYRVLGRVQRIVDIRSTAMIPMKTACIVLEGVHFSGEFQWFGEQHDYLYWREAWLQPIAPPMAEG